ncbi:MAG TPA: tRNA (cytidine(34)-2'-O)-methyltransferase [Magnetospirillum sp.]|jgi:tRNA (cytidine/uridine-2'-O-)-methyltransferase|nr:tRNA (cytidine(34)-2'-O)-methyltransferase [Magnetospirillum sp.]
MSRPRLALYQPDIPQNAGALLRLAACLSFGVDVIEPCGFLWDEKRMRRAGMDYIDAVEVTRHTSWTAFQESCRLDGRRIMLLSTKASERLDRFHFQAHDVIMVGRESAGVPDSVADAADARVRIPLAAGVRSLNVALAASIAMAEALRQQDLFPCEVPP